MTAPVEPQNPSNLFTPFLPSTYSVPEEEDRRRTFLVDNFTNFSDVINYKKIGIYVQAIENFNGEKWYYQDPNVDRNGYQSICYIPSLPDTSTFTLTVDTTPQFPIPNINPQLVISMLYGTANKPPSETGAGDGDFFQYNNQGDSRISFTFSDTTLTITTTTDLSAYSGFIVVHYIRRGTL